MDAHQPHEIAAADKVEQALSAPRGWTKKLVPTKEKGVTLRKYDVVFIAPDGQELTSKWHLTRYLKAHPGGPSVSDFDWSSGEEFPVRRSGRVSTTDPRVTEKPTPKKRGKRNVSEMEGKEITDDQAKTRPGKRTKQATESAKPGDNNAVEASKGPSALDEAMHAVPDGSKGHGTGEVEAQVEKGDDEKSVEAMQVSMEELAAGIPEGVFADKAMDSNLGEQLKPSETGSAMDGEERDASPKVPLEVLEHVTKEVLTGDEQLIVTPESESKDDKMAVEAEEPKGKMVVEAEEPEDNEGKPEQLYDKADEEHKVDANKGTEETHGIQEVQLGVEKASSIPEEEQQKHVSSHDEGVDKPLEPLNPKEELPKPLVCKEAPSTKEKTADETNHSDSSVGAVNQ